MQAAAFFLRLASLVAFAAPALAAAPYEEQALRAWLEPQLAATAQREGLVRWEIDVGAPRAAATLAPCERSEFFLPPGARPWGRISVGVRCIQGARWTVLAPVTVSVWGTAVVAAAPMNAGTVLTEENLQVQELDLTREAPGAPREPEALAGRTLTRSVAAAQALRPEMTRATYVVQAGDAVRLRIGGSGFSIAASGQAMNNAGAGQTVRVRTEMGKILNGVAREGRIIDVTL